MVRRDSLLSRFCPDLEQAVSRRILSDKFIKSCKPAPTGHRALYLDAIVPGMGLRVSDRGHKSFVLLARYPLHPKNPTPRALGTYGVITLDQARQKARSWLEMIGRGVDPAVEARKRRAEAAKLITFDVLRESFLKHFEQKKKHGEAARILTKDFAAWNGRLATDIDAQDVDTAIQVIVARGSKYQARNAFGYIGLMYRWAMGKPALGIKSSPCEGLSADGLIGSKKTPRTRVLDDLELTAIWKACNHESYAYPYGAIVKMLLLTGARENEIARMRRSELIDTSEGTLLVIPSARMKGEDDDPPPPHEIPMTDRMLKIIDSLPYYVGPYLFTTTGGVKPVNGWSKAKERIDSLSQITGWRFHDLRRTMRTRISAIPAEEHVREALLAHGRRGIQAHYDQHKYRPEKRLLLEAWESKLLSIVEPPSPNVTSLDKARTERTAALA
jgi:integrase